MQRIGNFKSAVMFGLKIAKMKIALGSITSEPITGAFQREKQYSTIMPVCLSLANFMLLLQFSFFYHVNAAHGILQTGNNLD